MPPITKSSWTANGIKDKAASHPHSCRESCTVPNNPTKYGISVTNACSPTPAAQAKIMEWLEK